MKHYKQLHKILFHECTRYTTQTRYPKTKHTYKYTGINYVLLPHESENPIPLLHLTQIQVIQDHTENTIQININTNNKTIRINTIPLQEIRPLTLTPLPKKHQPDK